MALTRWEFISLSWWHLSGCGGFIPFSRGQVLSVRLLCLLWATLPWPACGASPTPSSEFHTCHYIYAVCLLFPFKNTMYFFSSYKSHPCSMHRNGFLEKPTRRQNPVNLLVHVLWYISVISIFIAINMTVYIWVRLSQTQLLNLVKIHHTIFLLHNFRQTV